MRHGISNPEHVADHMYMMAVMTFFIQDDHNLNKERYEEHILINNNLSIINQYLINNIST